MLRKNDWLMVELLCLLLMVNAWPSLAEILNSNDTNTCSSKQFRCTTGICLPEVWVCDGEDDCADGSDEDPSICDNVTCSTDKFTCKDKRCVYRNWVCDGDNDCGDGSDEDPSICNNFTCPTNKFTCKNKRCIYRSWTCDQDNDCGDGSDEDPSICSKITCPADEFTCENNRCIAQTYVCDGDNDCGDNSDEKNCSYVRTRQPDTMFACSENNSIPYRWRCDGDTDCPDGSDEFGCNNTLIEKKYPCASNQFACNGSTIMCIHESWVCDGDKDCLDGADEQNCGTPGVVCDLLEQFDCGNETCIPISSLCDSKPDCPGQEDEQPYLCGRNECLIDNGGCAHICIDLPIDFRCECRDGYKLINNETCDDIDECLEPGSCSQFCTNDIGGFNCSCATGYLRDPQDYTRCKSVEGNASVLLAGFNGIRKAALDDQDMTVIVNSTGITFAIDFDFRNGLIFWSDGVKLYKASIDEGNNRTVVIDRVPFLEYLAVDWIYNHIYWTDSRRNTIEVANYEGNMRKTLINDTLSKPLAIAIDPLEGWMFWTGFDSNGTTRIQRAGMDGSHRSIIIETGPQWLSGLTLDLVGKKLFWVDTVSNVITSCNYEGSGQRIVLHLPNPFIPIRTMSITTFEDDIFWSDGDKDQPIFKANKFTGKEVGRVSNLTLTDDNIMSVLIYHPNRQPEGENHCQSVYVPCSHFCLPAPKIDNSNPFLFTCASP